MPPPSDGDEPTAVVGEIVLSDWLDELPLASLSLPDLGEECGEGVGIQGQVEVIKGQREHDGDAGVAGDSAPFRFQQLIQVTPDAGGLRLEGRGWLFLCFGRPESRALRAGLV